LGWYSPQQYSRAFGCGAAAVQSRKRWARKLSADQWSLRADGRYVRGDAVLPDGRTVAEAWQVAGATRLPNDVSRGTDRTRRKQLAAIDALARYRAFCREHPQWGKSSPTLFAAFFKVQGAFLREHGLPASRSRWIGRDGLIARVSRNEPVDGRTRSGRKPGTMDDRLVEAVKEFYLHPNKLTETSAFEEQRRVAWELGIAALTRHQVRRIVAAIPKAAKVLAREGPRALEAKCVPKVRRDYSDLGAGEWVCMDGRVPDRHVRVADGRGGWKLKRPFVTGVLDVVSGLLEVDVRETENCEGRLAAAKRWCIRHGVPRHWQDDNAEASKRAFGSPRGSAWQRKIVDDRRLGSVLAQLGVELHPATPYTPWSKKIESIWRLLGKHSDKFFAGYWGNRPSERPEDAAKLLRENPELVPTLDEYREHLQTAVETYNATPRRALGALSPNLVFEQRQREKRVLSEDAAQLVFTPIEERPRRVLRDGVTYRGILYRLSPEEAVTLQGRAVYVRPDIDLCGQIWLCGADGKPLAIAQADRLIRCGADSEQLRAAMKEKARFRRLAREYMPGRNFLLETTEGQILRKRAEYARARERELRAKLAPPAAPPVQIVRPDLTAAVRKVKSRARMAAGSRSRLGRDAGGTPTLPAIAGETPALPIGAGGGAAARGTETPAASGFARLAELYGSACASEPAALDPAARPDLFSDDGRKGLCDVYDRLAGAMDRETLREAAEEARRQEAGGLDVFELLARQGEARAS
jgi:hypothetical protein